MVTRVFKLMQSRFYLNNFNSLTKTNRVNALQFKIVEILESKMYMTLIKTTDEGSEVNKCHLTTFLIQTLMSNRGKLVVY